MRIVLLGPPGAGKGTQGERLAERCGVPKYSTGDLFRTAVERGSELGRKVAGYLDRGDLVPDGVVLDVIGEALAEPAARAGFVLDGFPRTSVQAEGLRQLLDERGSGLDRVVHFVVPEQELVRRLAGRRVCVDCGAVYNMYSDPPGREGVCDRCGGKLETREDDREETVRRRLRVYQESTTPVLEYYQQSSIPVLELDAVGPVDEVFERLLSATDCS